MDQPRSLCTANSFFLLRFRRDGRGMVLQGQSKAKARKRVLVRQHGMTKPLDPSFCLFQGSLPPRSREADPCGHPGSTLAIDLLSNLSTTRRSYYTWLSVDDKTLLSDVKEPSEGRTEAVASSGCTAASICAHRGFLQMGHPEETSAAKSLIGCARARITDPVLPLLTSLRRPAFEAGFGGLCIFFFFFFELAKPSKQLCCCSPR